MMKGPVGLMRLHNAGAGARWLLFTAVFLLGAFLRLHHIAAEDIWFDEGFSYFAIKAPDMLDALTKDDHPPTYFAALRAWTDIFGRSEFALRSLSWVFTLLTLAAVVPLAREISRLRPHPAASAIPFLAFVVLAMQDMQQYIAQETRMYAMLGFFAALSMWAFLRWLRTGQRSTAVLWVIFTALCPWTHYLGAWVGVTQGLYALLFTDNRRRILTIAGLMIAALTFVPWLQAAVIPFQLQKVGTQIIGTRSTPETIFGFIEVFLSQAWVFTGILAIFGLVVVWPNTGPRHFALRSRPWRAPALLLLWIMVPFWLTFAFNFRFDILADHRLAYLDIPLALLIAYGLANLQIPGRWVLTAALILYSVIHFDIYRPRQPWSAFGQDAAEYVVPGEPVLIDVGGGDFQLEYYVDRFAPPGTDVRSVKRWQTWRPATFDREIRAFLNQHDAFWFAQWSDYDMEPLASELGFVPTARRLTPDWQQPWHTTRYDRLNVSEPIATFANGMALLQAVSHTSPLRLDLWWRTDRSLSAEYTVSAFLLNSGGELVAQWDAYPFNGEAPTSGWQAGQIFYDPHLLVANRPLTPGTYTFGVSVYQLANNEIVVIPAADDSRFVLLNDVNLP